jgi:hypothetical protein
MQLKGLANQPWKMKLISYVFSNQVLPEKAAMFKEEWIRLMGSLDLSEPDVASRTVRDEPESTLEELMAAQSSQFRGLIFFDKLEEDLSPLDFSLVPTIDVLSPITYAVKTVGFDLSRDVRPQDNIVAAPKHLSVNSTTSLIRLCPSRNYTEQNGISITSDIDNNVTASLAEIKAKKRQFPAPFGAYTRMGEMIEYVTPALPQGKEERRLKPCVADFAWLYFKNDVLNYSSPDSDCNEEFEKLRGEICYLEGCEALRWGNSEEKPNEVAIIICESLSLQVFAQAGLKCFVTILLYAKRVFRLEGSVVAYNCREKALYHN